jgi:hypothetical protein
MTPAPGCFDPLFSKGGVFPAKTAGIPAGAGFLFLQKIFFYRFFCCRRKKKRILSKFKSLNQFWTPPKIRYSRKGFLPLML